MKSLGLIRAQQMRHIKIQAHSRSAAIFDLPYQFCKAHPLCNVHEGIDYNMSAGFIDDVS